VKQKLGTPKSTYRHNAQISEYQLVQKRYHFDPLLTSLMQQA
jgi:hypothetical protein